MGYPYEYKKVVQAPQEPTNEIVTMSNHLENEAMEEGTSAEKEVYLPGKPIADDEELTHDPSAYIMFHQAQTSAPCLSFDIIKDNLGEDRETFPLTSYIVAGTQASKSNLNNVLIIKLSNLRETTAQMDKAKNEDDEDTNDDDDDDDDEEEYLKQPKMTGALIKHQGCINRIRNTVINNKSIAASWSELGRVNIWDLTKQLRAVDSEALLAKYIKENEAQTEKPIFTFTGHTKEGFSLDWSSTMPGVLATGDTKKDIHIWTPSDGATWAVDQRPLIGHQDSVEDLQWSPLEKTVLASCSVDKSIRIWDIRAHPNRACMITCDNAHTSDINVINWNRNESFIVSGGDDGFLHVWDLRLIKNNTTIATFKHHNGPVTTVEWHPKDAAVFASGGADNQIAIWDLSVEKDTINNPDDIDEIPPQLLFIHQGQNNVKELHWHPQCPGVIISTAESGFNIFKTISV